jgi:TonB family protein
MLALPTLVAAQGVLLTPPAGAVTPTSRMLTSLISFVGDDPDDCGRFPLRPGPPLTVEDLQPALDCADAASSVKRAFWLFTQHPGRSFAAAGLLGTPDGRVWRFTYDTSSCTSNDCFGQLLVVRCAGPRLHSAPNGTAEWACSSEPDESIPPIRPPAPASPCTPTLSGSTALSSLEAAWIRLVVRRIRTAWVQPTEALTTNGTVGIEFDVLRDGTVADVTLTARVSAPLDAAALRALEAASPLPPLPASYAEPKAHLSMTFCYNV